MEGRTAVAACIVAALLCPLAAGEVRALRCVNRGSAPSCAGVTCGDAGALPTLALAGDGSTTLGHGVVTTTTGPDLAVRAIVIDDGRVRVEAANGTVGTIKLATKSGRSIVVEKDGAVKVEDGSYELVDGTAIVVENGRMRLERPLAFSVGTGGASVVVGDRGLESIAATAPQGGRVTVSANGGTVLGDGAYRLVDGTEVRLEGGTIRLPADLRLSSSDGAVSVSIGDNGMGEVVLSTPEGGTVRIDASGDLRAADGAYTVNGKAVQASGGRLPEGTLSLAGGGTAEVRFDVGDRFAGRVETQAGTIAFEDGKPTGKLRLVRDGRELALSLDRGEGSLSLSGAEGSGTTTFDRRGVVGGTLVLGPTSTISVSRGPLGDNVAAAVVIDGQRLTFDPHGGPSGKLAVAKDGNSYALDLDRGTGTVRLADGSSRLSFGRGSLDGSLKLGDGGSVDIRAQGDSASMDVRLPDGGSLHFDPSSGFVGGFVAGTGSEAVRVDLNGNSASIKGNGVDVRMGPGGINGNIDLGKDGKLSFNGNKVSGSINTPAGTVQFGVDLDKLAASVGAGPGSHTGARPSGTPGSTQGAPPPSQPRQGTALTTPSNVVMVDQRGNIEAMAPPGGGSGSNVCTPRLLTPGSVAGGGGPGLDPKLLDCDKARTASNQRQHVDDLKGDLERANSYYASTLSNLVTIRRAFAQWCDSCKRAANEFNAKGYMPCGGALAKPLDPAAIAADDSFRPEVCGKSVDGTCPAQNRSAWCASGGGPSPKASACPLCLSLDCVYGDRCEIGFADPKGAGERPAPKPTQAPGAQGPQGGAPGPGGPPSGNASALCSAQPGRQGMPPGQPPPPPQQPRPSARPSPSPRPSATPGGQQKPPFDLGFKPNEATPTPSPSPGTSPTPTASAGNGTASPCSCQGARAPVCGADGLTYPNRCIASCLGVAVAREGSCDEWCDSDAACAPSQCCVAGASCRCVDRRCVLALASLAPSSTLAPSTPLGAAGFGGFGAAADGGWAALAARPPRAGLEAAAAQGGEGERCLPTDQGGQREACNSDGQPDSFKEKPKEEGTNAEDLGVKGCETKGAGPQCTTGDCARCDSCTRCGTGAYDNCRSQLSTLGCCGSSGGGPGQEGACARHICCGPGFKCSDRNKATRGSCGQGKQSVTCSTEDHGCTHVTQATLVTKRAKNVVPSPGGVAECAQNVADLKDVCTVEGSKALGGPTLDPCAVLGRLDSVIATLQDMVGRVDRSTQALGRMSDTMRAEQGAGHADRSGTDLKGEVERIARDLEGSKAGKAFQDELASLVRLFKDSAFLADISSNAQHQAPRFELSAKADGQPAKGLWEGYCGEFKLCASCQGPPTPAGCLGPTSKGSFRPSDQDWRGRCDAKGSGGTVSERSFDVWGDKRALYNFAGIDPQKDLFIDMKDCYEYDSQSSEPEKKGDQGQGGQDKNQGEPSPSASPTPSTAPGEEPAQEPGAEEGAEGQPEGAEETPAACVAVCRSCHGVDRAHCHAQLGVCVCESGAEWHLTSQSCEPSARPTADELACCARLTSASAEAAAGAGSDACAGPTLAGFTIDRCTEGSGLCCKHRFEELSVAEECRTVSTEDVRSCRDACTSIFDRATAQWCAQRCPSVELGCEQRCMAEGGGGSECLSRCSPSAPAATVSCAEGCLAKHPGKGEECLRACKATAPEGAASAYIGRPGTGGAAGQVLAVGDRVELAGSVNDTGAVALEGTARISLVTLLDCACPGEGCACREGSAVVGEVPVKLEPGAGVALTPAAASLTGESLVQALVEVVDASGAVLVSKRSPIAFVVSPGAVSVRDAFFVGAGGRTTEAYPNATVTGAVVLGSEAYPVTVSVSLERDGARVEGSEAGYTLTGPTDQPLASGSFTAQEGDLDAVVRIHVAVSDSAGSVILERTLEEQGLAPGACGENVTQWCLSQLGRVRPSYPAAFVHVRRLELAVRDAAFLDADSRAVASVFGSAELSASVRLVNRMSIPFSGTVEASVIREDGSRAATASRRASLGRGEEADVRVEGFGAEPPATYGLWARARDDAGRPWLDSVVDPQAFPGARLSATVRDPSSPGSHIDTVIGVGSCQIRVTCDGCSPACELHVEPADCRLVPRNCDCDCVY